MEDLCIIGGGLVGIACAKIALSYNLNPIIFERNSTFGGIWQSFPSNVGIWDNLHANLSKFMMGFSDHLWPESTEIFPLGSEYLNYISSYIAKHNIIQYFHFNTEVTLLEKSEQGYLVVYKNQEGTHSRVFKNVIVATGINSKPNDAIKNKENFKGKIIHAAYYRGPSLFENKSVVIIGSSYSSCDIASELSKVAKSVKLVYRKKFCINTRIVAGIPGEFHDFNFPLLSGNPPLFFSIQGHANYVKFLLNALGNPGEIDEELRLTEEEVNSEYIGLPINTMEFLEQVRNKEIALARGEASEYFENGVVLASGQFVEADIVIDATGYYPNLSFLGEKIREITEYDPKYKRIPLTLFRTSVHPALPGLGFAGFSHSFASGMYELSAEICVRWVKGELGVSEEELWQGVEDEKKFRPESLRVLWVYDFFGFQKELIRILKVEFNWDLISSLGFSKGAIGPVFFYKNRPGQEEIVREWVRQVKQAFPGYPSS